MERELEKTLMEIEHLIKVHEQRENTHTQSVLEQAREIIELCAQAARTPSDLKKILERDTAKAPIDADEDYGFFTCPSCGESIYASDDFESHKFCLNCGQRLKWEEW